MRLILSALLALAVSPLAQAAATLHVSSAVQDRALQMDVTLADSYLAIDTEQGRMLYDFQARRRYAVNTPAKEYVEYSLFDTVGFRVVEMSNRDQLRSVLDAAKLNTPVLGKADDENQLSVLSGAPGAMEEKEEGGQRVLYIDGVKLAAWSASGAKVAAADAAQFARFLRYAQAGHPQVLDKLAKAGMIPDHLTFFVSGGRDMNLTMTQVRSAQPPAYDLKPYHREISKGGIDALFDRIAALTPQQLADLRAEHPCDASADFSEPAILDTMLGKMECTLSTGAPLSLTDEQKQAMAASPTLALMFAAINPAKANEMEGSVKTLAALRPKAPRKAYMLKLFEANNRVRMDRKQGKESAALLVEVLQANPVLAGAYKDLGDMLLMQYDSARAWRSWDAGRRLAPTLPNFEPVNKFEASLLAQHPEFF
ncbi:hypothetical protein GJ698_15570 [Pseudoduganella sp. FT26W]|uniref:DUF2330 domain-containing protein n=1 Tax=Duganella aquatilis TaxID=2666082 RepID=A0A844D3K3_9BURK|nr:hypothetical protein [Duganella aquatilis]MRW85501.1 hypothetical protein [Duganella aquatilis]